MTTEARLRHARRGRMVARHALLLAVAALAACLVDLRADAGELTSSSPASRRMVTAPGDIHIATATYVLDANPGTGVISLGTPSGLLITSLPLTALVGRSALPEGSRTHVATSGGTLTAETVGPRGVVLVRSVLTPGPRSLSIAISALPGPVRTASPVFLSDGVHGLDLAGAVASWTADPQQPADGSEMIVSAIGRRPLTPPPFLLQWEVPQAGWFGVGLAGIPDATSMWLSQQGVAVDYPLDLLGRVTDTGGGGVADGMLSFPPLVVTLGAPSQRDGLIAYREALVGLGDAPSSAAAPPAWAWQPIVDTWGEQMAEHVERGSKAFTAAWVRHFVSDWTARYGVSHATVVIDSRWQQTLGDPTPDARRFGGVAGMRRLIDDLHAAGMRVELWWPIWAHGAPAQRGSADQPGGITAPLDPSTPGADAQIAAAVREALGPGPGQLDADGLKLDWTYAMTPAVANPAAGYGVALLHHYLADIHNAAHSVRADAVVETSVAAPQFADVSDAVRLYDAWSEADWNTRAEIVTATLPGVPIDGDGWSVPPQLAAAHAVAAAVYGVPATYFGRLWANGTAVSAGEARVIGGVSGLAPLKGAGVAEPVAGGGWKFTGSAGTLAETLAGGHGLVVWSAPEASGSRLGRTVATVDGPQTVPLPLPETGRVTARDSAGRPVTLRPVRGGVRLTMVAGQVITLQVAPGR